MATALKLDDSRYPSLDLSDDMDMPGSSSTAFDGRYLLATLRRNLLLIAVVVAAVMALAVVATMLTTPRYTSSASIQINDASDRVLTDQQDPQSANAGFDIDRFLKTQVDVMKSRGLAARVARKLNLVGNARFLTSQKHGALPAGISPAYALETTVALLQSSLEVDLPRDSRIVSLAFTSTDPVISAQVANAYASEFIQSNLQRKFDSSSYARNFISGQLAEAKTRLETSERAINTYARSAGLINTQGAGSSGKGTDSESRGSGSVTTDSLVQLNRAANDAKAARITAEGRWRAVEGAPLLGAREVLANEAVSSLTTQRAQLEASLQQDRSRHLDDYPTVVDKRSQLAELNRQIQVNALNVRNSIRSDYLAAAAAEQALTAQVGQLKNETLSEQDRNVQYGLLSREADTNRQVYDGLLQRFKQLNAASGIALSNVSIVDEADIPRVPSSPKLLKNLAIALVVGMGLAALLVFGRDQLDDAIRIPEDVEEKLGLTLLGVIPRTVDGDLLTQLVDPKSQVSEAYNSLRGSLLYSTPTGLPQVMLVTSAQAAEGKSTTSLAIGTGLARLGKRVVLVDADLRRPTLHRRNNTNNDRGLSSLLTSRDTIDGVVQPSEEPNLSLLTSGPVPPSPSELLSSPRMEEVLRELAGKFDTVILDSPPVLGLADAPVLAALADGVVFVVQADRSRRGALRTALRRLRAMRPNMLGAVLTMFDQTKAGNRYSDYYGSEYYHYASDDGTRKD